MARKKMRNQWVGSKAIGCCCKNLGRYAMIPCTKHEKVRERERGGGTPERHTTDKNR